MTRSYFIILALLLLLFGAVLYLSKTMTPQRDAPQNVEQSRAAPEGASGLRVVKEVRAKHMMVAAANVHASNAGLSILKAGGNAVDAAIAVQLVLNVVEPQSSGIGGGAFLLFYDALSQKLESYDGRETAPQLVDEKLFLKEDGRKLSFGDAVRSGRSIGVPGVVAMLEAVHKRHGKLEWAALFQPAIKLASEGFKVSRRLSSMLTAKGQDFFNPLGQALFFNPDGSAFAEGQLLKNPALAASFKLIAREGASGFYKGQLAEDIVAAAKAAPNVPSKLSLQDFAEYKAKMRAPVCGLYLKHKVCGMGLPSSGGMTSLMILKLIEPKDLGTGATPAALHLIAEAEKLAYADRGRYMADPDFVSAPMGLLSEAYITERRRLISSDSAIKQAEPGTPPGQQRGALGRDGTVEIGGTSHISIIDGFGNALSLTSSIEGAFGSGQLVGGFLLNNQLTDFSFAPTDETGAVIANRVAPSKRPRSSMAPTIVFGPEGKVRLVLGSPGGSRIIGYVVKSLIAHLNWGMGPQEAVSLFNFGSRNGPFELERHEGAEKIATALQAFGQSPRLSVMTSGVQMIVSGADGLRGGADPRREGVVVGE
ncbi:MAG: gamma-glutamyltranspeptidase [Rhodomicrobium sp.]|nr:MAG: gamma-glutamyltranspeptidase [Rhodomicrobium sp.]